MKWASASTPPTAPHGDLPPGHGRGGGGQAGPGQPGLPAAGVRQDRLRDPHRLYGAGVYPDFIHLNHRCVQLGIPCLTSLDTAGALTDILEPLQPGEHGARRYLPSADGAAKLPFAKMQTCGNDYIFLENFSRGITRSPVPSPSATGTTASAPTASSSWRGIPEADAKMRMFNADGSGGSMAGNALRCMAKYLYDNGIVRKGNDPGDGQGHQDRPGTTDGRVTLCLRGHGLRDPGHHGPPAEYPEAAGGELSGGDCRAALGDHLRGHGQSPLRGVLFPEWTAWMWPDRAAV
ncbi:MAG: hypothetical protein ACLTYN_11610 [Dysosmobacter welbionis]